jgi:hypothetical protein
MWQHYSPIFLKMSPIFFFWKTFPTFWTKKHSKGNNIYYVATLFPYFSEIIANFFFLKNIPHILDQKHSKGNNFIWQYYSPFFMKNIANFLIEKHSPHLDQKHSKRILCGNILLFSENYCQSFKSQNIRQIWTQKH